jgi:O-antigen/teichoic acid export membrane protein
MRRNLMEAIIGSAGLRVAGMVATFVVGVQLARYLGPEGYGVYGTVMAYVALLAVAGQFGLPQLLTREIAANCEVGEHARVKGAMYWFAILIGVASVIVIIIGYIGVRIRPVEYSPTHMSAYVWGLYLIPIVAFLNYVASALRGFHRVVSAQLYDTLMRPILFGILLLLGFNLLPSLDTAAALAFQLSASTLTLAACAVHLHRITPIVVREQRPERHDIEWRSSAVPMAVTEMLRVLTGHYSILLLGVMAASDQVGIFRVALASATFIGLASSLINVVVMPYVAQLYSAQKTKQLQLVASGCALVMFGYTAIISCVIYLAGEFLLIWVFGKPFASSWWPLLLMAIAYLINAAFGSVATILNMCSQEGTVTKSYALGLATGILVTVALYPLVGITSAGLAMIVSEIVKGTIMWRCAKKQIAVDSSIFGLGLMRSPSSPSEKGKKS